MKARKAVLPARLEDAGAPGSGRALVLDKVLDTVHEAGETKNKEWTTERKVDSMKWDRGKHLPPWCAHRPQAHQHEEYPGALEYTGRDLALS